VTVAKRRWPVRLTAAADADFRNILHWTAETFGRRQARAYSRILSAAIEALAEGPSVAGAKSRDEIARGLFTLHVAGGGRKGRHLVMFRIGRNGDRDVIEVLRVVHDAMDLPRHVPKTSDDRNET
jgi:toxin ParE1/3/4